MWSISYRSTIWIIILFIQKVILQHVSNINLFSSFYALRYVFSLHNIWKYLENMWFNKKKNDKNFISFISFNIKLNYK